MWFAIRLDFHVQLNEGSLAADPAELTACAIQAASQEIRQLRKTRKEKRNQKRSTKKRKKKEGLRKECVLFVFFLASQSARLPRNLSCESFFLLFFSFSHFWLTLFKRLLVCSQR